MSDVQLLAREAEGLPPDIIAELLSLARLFKREEAARHEGEDRILGFVKQGLSYEEILKQVGR
jgi:hypothetical protein